MKKWGLADSAACECVEPEQTADHIININPHRPPSEAGLLEVGPLTRAWLQQTELTLWYTKRVGCFSLHFLLHNTCVFILTYHITHSYTTVPLMPNVGPWDGWRTQANAFLWQWAPSAWTKPIAVVLLPSPRGVGVILQPWQFVSDAYLHKPTQGGAIAYLL